MRYSSLVQIFLNKQPLFQNQFLFYLRNKYWEKKHENICNIFHLQKISDFISITFNI